MSRYALYRHGGSGSGRGLSRFWTSDDLAEVQAWARQENAAAFGVLGGYSAAVDTAPEEVRYDLGEEPLPVWLRLS